MAKTTLYLDKRRKNKEEKYPLCIRLNVKNKAHFIRLGSAFHDHEWDSEEKKVVGIAKANRITNEMKNQLKKVERYLEWNALEVKQMDIDSLKRALRVELKKNSGTSKSAIAKELLGKKDGATIEQWGGIMVQRALDAGRKGTADWYHGAINMFKRFNDGKDIAFIDINETFLEEFKVWCAKEIKGVKKSYRPNSTGNYMSAVRAMMNQATKEKREYFPMTHQPFRNVGIPVEVIEVDSITKTDIIKLRELDLEMGSELWKARARFLFLFNSQGMNWTDLAKLKVGDCYKRTFSYFRSKTSRKKKRKKIEVYMTKESLLIWDYFAKEKKKDEYSFDVLTVHEKPTKNYHKALVEYNISRRSKNPAVTEKNRIKARMKNQNKLLGELSEMIDCKKKITTYDARYGYVNAALDVGVSEELIGKALGHGNLAVTRTYFEERHKKSSLGTLNDLITQ